MSEQQLVERESKAIINLGVTDEYLSEIREIYGTIPDLKTKDGYTHAKTGLALFRKLRAGVEKKKKKEKAPHLEACSNIDNEFKRVMAEIRKIENPLSEAKTTHDKEVEREREEKRQAEIARIEAIVKRLNNIRALAVDCVGKSSDDITRTLNYALDINTGEGFDEMQEIAEQAKASAVESLELIYNKALEQEKAQAEIDAEKERIAAEDAARKAELDKQAEEQRQREAAEREELAKQQEALRQREEELKRKEQEQQAREQEEAERIRQEKEAESAKKREAERIEDERKEAEKRARIEAERKPDKEKLAAWANAIFTIELPALNDEHVSSIGELCLTQIHAAAAQLLKSLDRKEQ